MRSSRKLYSLLTNSPRVRVRSGPRLHHLQGASRQLVSSTCSLPAGTRGGDEVKSTAAAVCSPWSRQVHSSGPWPNTQPHVLNGEGGLHQLTTVEELKSWFEKRKKEIYGKRERQHIIYIVHTQLHLPYYDLYTKFLIYEI